MNPFKASQRDLSAFLSSFESQGKHFQSMVGNKEMFSFGMDSEFSPPLGLVARAHESAGDMRGAKAELERIRDNVIIPSIKQNFKMGGRPRPWKELSSETIMRRNRDGFASGPILRRSHRMYESATAKARFTIGVDKAQHVMTLSYGTGSGAFPQRTWYGPVHQLGGDFSMAGGATLPARPFAVIQEQDADKIFKMLGDWTFNKYVKSMPKGSSS